MDRKQKVQCHFSEIRWFTKLNQSINQQTKTRKDIKFTARSIIQHYNHRKGWSLGPHLVLNGLNFCHRCRTNIEFVKRFHHLKSPWDKTLWILFQVFNHPFLAVSGLAARYQSSVWPTHSETSPFMKSARVRHQVICAPYLCFNISTSVWSSWIFSWDSCTDVVIEPSEASSSRGGRGGK